MDLDIGNPILHNLMVNQLPGYHGRVHQALLNAHGKKVVGISAKCLAVKEIPPPADDLACNPVSYTHLEEQGQGYLKKAHIALQGGTGGEQPFKERKAARV